jgi:flagella basal body P-ring formation protein FlgA
MRALLALVLVVLGVVRANAADRDVVRAAIVQAVAQRLGGKADVIVTSLEIRSAGALEGQLRAIPEPGARIGRPSVFSLTLVGRAGARRIGSAVADLEAVADHVRVRRVVSRGEVLDDAALESMRGPVTDVLLRTLPGLANVSGARATRDLESGDVVTAERVAAAPTVRSGQQVALTARIGQVEVRTIGVATANAALGDVIRVVNPESRRTVVGRVVAPGEVEVMYGS